MAFAILFAITGIVIGATIPYHFWDALALGEWSRLIAETGGFHFPGISEAFYQRPLFYVLQGWTWRIFGFDERSGRLLSFAFALLLVFAVARLARRGPEPRLRMALAVLFLLLIPDFLINALGGLTDVPGAALLTLTALLAWTPRPSRLRIAAIVVCAAATVLAKPPQLMALASLAAAMSIGPRAELRRRLLGHVVPLAMGCLLGLLYDQLEALRLNESLREFLTLGLGTERGAYYAGLADRVRWQTGWEVLWLGPYLVIPLLFALVYSSARVAGIAHRAAALAAAPLALFLSWLAPWIGNHGARVNLGVLDSRTRALEYSILALCLLAGAFAPAAVVPSRLLLARLVIWALPTFVVWLVAVPFATRYLSPTWPAVVLLLAATAAPALIAAVRRVPPLAVAFVVVLVLFGARNITNFDDLGEQGWRQFRAAGFNAWTDQDRMRNLVLGSFTEELAAVRNEVGSNGHVFTSDERLRFYFPRRVDSAYPRACKDLEDSRAFVLLLDSESASYLENQIGASADPDVWARCSFPRLRLVAHREGVFAAFAVGDHDRAWEAVFGRFTSAEPAERLLERVRAVGFEAAAIQRDAETEWEVSLEGLKRSQLREFAAEAKRAGFTVAFEFT